jgi:hypothetical protein
MVWNKETNLNVNRRKKTDKRSSEKHIKEEFKMNAHVISGVFPEIDHKRNSGYEYIQKPTTQDQKESKPKIDNVICHYLDGDPLKDALNFIEYIRASKMKIKWSAVNVWKVTYKRKHVLDIRITDGVLSVRLVYDHLSTRKGYVSYEDIESFKQLIGSLKLPTPEFHEPLYAAPLA